MLTTQDLSQIRTLLKEEIKLEVGTVVKKIVREELKPVNKKLNKIDKDLKTTINFFDNELLGHDKRISKIEAHIGLSPNI